MPIIEVCNVTKKFRLGQNRTLRQTLANAIARLGGKEAQTRKVFEALHEVSFSIEPGEIVGIIGHNGAGKSTLLKLLARISRPSTGTVSVKGKVAPLIEVGAGLVAELTGRENVYLNGAILGMKRAEIRKKFDEIVAFAEIEEFIDTPLKRYSSGMQVRLGFAIAASVDADILIADEVLAVGDINFQRKCYDRMRDMLLHEGRTVLLVSHDLREVERMCRRAFLLDHGCLIADGPAHEVCGLFFEHSHKRTHDLARTGETHANIESSGEVEVLELALLDERGERASVLPYEAPFSFRLRFRAAKELTSLIVEMGIQTTDFLKVAGATSEHQLHIDHLGLGVHEVQCRFDRMPFLPGIYTLWLILSQGEPSHGVFWGDNLLYFQVSQGSRPIPLIVRGGLFELGGSWSAAQEVSRQIEIVD
jgi:ABC-type polysaccharide/polyol phosphate transport system ATPase subunit